MYRRVNWVQKARLIAIMKEHMEFLYGKSKAPEECRRRDKKWDEVAKDLNGRGMGAIKDGKDWRQTFSNMRLTVYEKLRTIRLHTQRGEPLPANMGLTDFDESIIRLCMPDWQEAYRLTKTKKRHSGGYPTTTVVTVANVEATATAGKPIDQMTATSIPNKTQRRPIKHTTTLAVANVRASASGNPNDKTPATSMMPSRADLDPRPNPKPSTSSGPSFFGEDDDLIEQVKIEPCTDPLAPIVIRSKQVEPKLKPSASLTICNSTFIDDDLIDLVKVEPYFELTPNINAEDTQRTPPASADDIPDRPLSGKLQETPVAPRLDETQGGLLHTLENNALIRERNELLRQQNDLLQKMHSSTESYRNDVLAHYKEMREMKRRKLVLTFGEAGRV